MARTPAVSPDKRRAAARETGRKPSRAAVAVDTALLTLVVDADGALSLAVLEVKRDQGGWTLPGTYLTEGEPLAGAVRRSLADSAGVEGLAPRQLQVVDAPGRDEHGWVLSVAFLDAGPADHLEGRLPTTRLASADAPGRLPHGQGDIVARAVEELRTRYTYAPDPDGFLPDSFSLRELRMVHEAVAGYEVQRDTFRRAMEPLLTSTGQVAVGGRGRPAELFSRA